MKVGEALGYGILLIIGLGAIKIFGGVKGLTDMFGGLFGGGTTEEVLTSKTPEEILTETSKLEQQYADLTPAGQELAQAKVSTELVKTAMKTDPYVTLLKINEPFMSMIPIIGDMYKATLETIEQHPETVEEAATLRYVKEQARMQIAAPENVTFEEPAIFQDPTASLHGAARIVTTEQGTSIVRMSGR